MFSWPSYEWMVIQNFEGIDHQVDCGNCLFRVFSQQKIYQLRQILSGIAGEKVTGH